MTKSKNGYKKLFMSFIYAFRGMFKTLMLEQNMRIHFVCMLYMYSYLFIFDFFKVTRTQIAILFVANALVFAAEMFNTAIESTVDLVTDEKRKMAETAKDTAAGAVLVCAIFSVAVGIAILWQPEAFKLLFNYYIEKPIRIAEFLLSVIVFSLFIFKGIPFIKSGKE